ncbi:MAG: GNAT family N-acetyltransferase [Capsulimonas sp.]|uniref:GNAT family N-acetyltransferase n=1 Tax=Capsulimonas sp. TaxID=2494211 RepID=UPI0032678D7B
MTPILETPRLLLRPLQLSDAPRNQELFPHWEVVRYMASVIPWPYPDDGAQKYVEYALAEVAAGKRYSWALTLKAADDDLLIGAVELTPTNPENSRDFWIGLPYQRQGYMTEAVAAVNDFAFDVLELPYLRLNNAEANVGSHRLKEKSGAEISKITEDVLFVSGKHRRVGWTLTREQWSANRHRFTVE